MTTNNWNTRRSVKDLYYYFYGIECSYLENPCLLTDFDRFTGKEDCFTKFGYLTSKQAILP